MAGCGCVSGAQKRPSSSIGHRGAVSDNQDFQSPRQPAGLRPIRVARIRPERLAIEQPVLLETAHNIPAIVANPLQETPGWRPRVAEDIRRATTMMVEGIAEQLQGQGTLRGATLAPKPHPQGDAQPPICPAQPDEGEAVHRSVLLGGEDPGQALHRGGKGLGNDRLVNDEITLLPDEARATGAHQAGWPGPIRLHHPRHTPWDPVCNVSANATQVGDVQSSRKAVR
jgi:hypothetical protein